MFGRKTFAAEGVAAEREAAVLRDAGLTVESFAGFGKLLMGTRRHNLVYVDDLTAETEADGLAADVHAAGGQLRHGAAARGDEGGSRR